MDQIVGSRPSASTIGRSTKDNATAPSQSTLNSAESSICCRAETAKALRKWLEYHPGVEVITRDRWAAFANAASSAAPRPLQVADRWHLLKNMRAAIEGTLAKNSSIVRDALADKKPADKADAMIAPSSASIPKPTSPVVPPASAAPSLSPKQPVRPAKRHGRRERFERRLSVAPRRRQLSTNREAHRPVAQLCALLCCRRIVSGLESRPRRRLGSIRLCLGSA